LPKMMKQLLLIVFVMFALGAQADQLAYISKEQAEEVAAYLNKGKTVYLFCGCCSMEKPTKVKVAKAKAKYTGYEYYWEVVIEWQVEGLSQLQRRSIDLAYVWQKGLFGYKTLGSRFDMDHDYCVKPNKWDDPKHQEKDI